MASYKAINGIMTALVDYLNKRLPNEFEAHPMSASVSLLGSKDLAGSLKDNIIGLYLYRVIVDTQGRNRYLKTTHPDKPPQPELPLNLHFLLIVNGKSNTEEMNMLGWAMQQLSSSITLSHGDLLVSDPQWTASESVQVNIEHLSTEDLFRIWEVLKASYTISVPYIIRTVRMLPAELHEADKPVITTIMPTGDF